MHVVFFSLLGALLVLSVFFYFGSSCCFVFVFSVLVLVTRYPPSVSFTFSDLRAFLLPPFSRGRVIAIRIWLIASATSGCAIGLVLILF